MRRADGLCNWNCCGTTLAFEGFLHVYDIVGNNSKQFLHTKHDWYLRVFQNRFDHIMIKGINWMLLLQQYCKSRFFGLFKKNRFCSSSSLRTKEPIVCLSSQDTLFSLDFHWLTWCDDIRKKKNYRIFKVRNYELHVCLKYGLVWFFNVWKWCSLI